MGRKKGKQGGNFGYKSKSAAFATEINNYVSEHYSSRPRQRQNVNGNGNGNKSSNARTSTISMRSSLSASSASGGGGGARKALVGLTQLRGILRERMMEDRQRDANHRRIFTTTTRTRQRHSITSALAQTQQTLSCNKEIPPVGWLMNYDHRERMAGILPRKAHHTIGIVPSLHSLCIDALAPVLNAYIEALGETYIHNRLGFLPSTTISEISVRCQDINNSMAYAVGAHSHVDRCVWNGKPSAVSYNNDDDADDDIGLNHLTTSGLIEALLVSSEMMTMTPQCINETQELLDGPTYTGNGNGNDDDNDNVERKDILDSWEDADSDDRMTMTMMEQIGQIPSNRRNRNLKRLELRNFHPPTAEGAIDVLTKCPGLTHLSLGNSLDAQTGPPVLLWDWDAHAHSFTSDANFDIDADYETRPVSDSYSDDDSTCTRSLVDLFQNLEVLDLSGCRWLDGDVFNSFITRLVNKKLCYRNTITDDDDDVDEYDDDDNDNDNDNDNNNNNNND
eukprot:CAMPEP_0194118390 /NCGR_PEP_ID=MMETSP0150-20130528/35243_1 /TAXON_ID=122233 /ORGANISM="Chaetoceros debilis, Strain MM31A-1" /LENGTH=506 /DNA_ID=CAMNT_0038809737 /DNA_START=79 /DNA_END=1596 /DNA_ORIENTATION=-